MPEALMTPDQVAEYLAVPVATLYAWRHRGGGPPATRVGRHLRYDPARVQEWLDAHTESSPAR
jgi:excisionase family DNA binding protein